jgi:predicted Zn-dependent protease
MKTLIVLALLTICVAPGYATDKRFSDGLRTVEQEWYLAREREPVMQAEELEADRIGMTVVCEAGIPRGGALGLFDRTARAEAGTSYLQSHDDPLERRVIVAEWARAQNLVCLD